MIDLKAFLIDHSCDGALQDQRTKILQCGTKFTKQFQQIFKDNFSQVLVTSFCNFQEVTFNWKYNCHIFFKLSCMQVTSKTPRRDVNQLSCYGYR